MTEPATFTFDAGTLARGWLSAFLASSTDDLPVLDQTLNLETYTDKGIRLTATNRYMLLSAWVPTVDFEADEPGLDEAPDVTLTFRDDDARAKGLLTYLLKVAKRCAKDGVPVPTVQLHLGVEAEEGETPGFPGMEREQVALEFPGNESVRCDVVEGKFPSWRTLLAQHRPVKTDNVVLNPDLLANVAALGKIVGSHLRFTSGGVNKMVALAPAFPCEDGMTVRGGLMPVRVAEAADAEDAA